MSTPVATDGHPAAPPAGAGAGRWCGRGLRGALLLAAVSLLVALAGGCGGGGGSPNVANLGSSTTTGGTTTAGSQAAGASSGTPPASSSSPPAGAGGQFAVAGAGPKFAQFAACMRTHGEATFYPNAQGVISGNAIDPNSPQFQHAIHACGHVAPGGGIPVREPSPAGSP